MLMRSQRLVKLWYFGNRSMHINHGVISQGSSKYHSKTLEGPDRVLSCRPGILAQSKLSQREKTVS